MPESPRKSSPLFSRLSIALAAVFVLVMVIAVWISGGASFNPGPLTAMAQPGVQIKGFSSHADFETQCGLCHGPSKADQAGLCNACHTNVATQIASQQGTHGHLDNPTQCSSCHAEHKGKNFDPVKTALDSFDHMQTAFHLTGKHGTVACTDCHLNGRFDQANPQCVTCHQEPKAHADMFGTDCAACHTTSAWNPGAVEGKSFDHERTSFSLARHQVDYQNQTMNCTACHTGPDVHKIDLTACVSCHDQHDTNFMQKHLALYGPTCTTCHDGVDRTHGFQHDAVFPLTGKHENVACEKCHADQKFRGTSALCSSCHQEPQIHAGFFGLKCELCHTDQGWNPAMLIKHTFPIDHGKQGDQKCQTCHTGPYTQYTCYTCHDHQADEIAQSHAKAGISATQLPDCTKCHLDGLVHKP